jgi:hypothetical protein
LEILDIKIIIAASNLQYKSWLGSIAECVIAHTPAILIERESVIEDTVLIEKMITTVRDKNSENDVKRLNIENIENTIKNKLMLINI